MKTDKEWKSILTPQQYRVMRKEGTERAFTSELNDEKRKGTYQCAACGLELFYSDHKFESGTGWPSFYDTVEGNVETKKDFKLILPRTEFHCRQCGSHLGHVFEDGPEPTGQRWCTNGIALTFRADH